MVKGFSIFVAIVSLNPVCREAQFDVVTLRHVSISESFFFLFYGRGFEHMKILDRINELASRDPVHRKLFVRGLAWETTTETLREVRFRVPVPSLKCWL